MHIEKEKLKILAQSCERCANVLWNMYLSDEDGYEEFFEEWYKANTLCDFCKEQSKREE